MPETNSLPTAATRYRSWRRCAASRKSPICCGTASCRAEAARRVPARRAQAARDFRRSCRRHRALSEDRASDGYDPHRGELSRQHRGGVGRRQARERPAAVDRPAGQDPDHDRHRLPLSHGQAADRAAHRSLDRRELLPHVLRSGAAAGGRQGVRRLADPLCRAQLQRLDLHRPGGRLDPRRPVQRRRGGHRRAEGPAARRRQRGGDAHAAGDRHARGRPRPGCARPSPRSG